MLGFSLWGVARSLATAARELCERVREVGKTKSLMDASTSSLLSLYIFKAHRCASGNTVMLRLCSLLTGGPVGPPPQGAALTTQRCIEGPWLEPLLRLTRRTGVRSFLVGSIMKCRVDAFDSAPTANQLQTKESVRPCSTRTAESISNGKRGVWTGTNGSFKEEQS
jgi:hypothetical protein